jgi:putative heme transporter
VAFTIFHPSPRSSVELPRSGDPDQAPHPGTWRSVLTFARRHRCLVLAGTEVAAVVAAVALVGTKVPGLVSSVGANLGKLRHPSPLTLVVALAAETVSLLASAVIPRLLLREHRVRLALRDAFAIGITANGLSVILPGGAVPSGVWQARQLNRRGACPTLAAWSVLAGGFASSVTLIVLLLLGAGVAGVISALWAVVLIVLVLAGSAAFLAAVHRVDRLHAWSTARGRDDHDRLLARLVARFAGLAGEAARWRAGWRTGTEVLAAAAINWLADAGCLIAAFALVGTPVPWRTVLVAYAAGQLLGAVVPLPGGLGAVEGGLVGTLVALGSAAGPVVVVVAIYRLVGYWLPAVAALPAYGWARRSVGPAVPSPLTADPAAPRPVAAVVGPAALVQMHPVAPAVLVAPVAPAALVDSVAESSGRASPEPSC